MTLEDEILILKARIKVLEDEIEAGNPTAHGYVDQDPDLMEGLTAVFGSPKYNDGDIAVFEADPAKLSDDWKSIDACPHGVPPTEECSLCGEDHECNPDAEWPEYDARGIYLCRVCPICVESKLAGYRPEVLTDPDYDHDEPINEDY